MILVRLRGRDAWHNLAAEEWLLDHAAAARVLVVYINDPAVVIGRHQNPWSESDPDALAAAGVRLARRTSGGGAVWHDPGVLNYSFLLPRRAYRRPELLETVQRALTRLGVETRVVHNTSLFSRDHKVAGHAFRLRGDVAMHHGTLLISADLDRLRAALVPACRVCSSSAISSIRAPVTNLATRRSDLTADVCIEALTAETQRMWGPIAQTLDERDLDADDVREGVERHRSWAWRFGETPPFTAEFDLPTATGGAALWRVEVREGRVTALRSDPPCAPPDHLVGMPFEPSLIAAALASLATGSRPVGSTVQSPR